MGINRKSFLIYLMFVVFVLSTVFAVSAADSSTYSIDEATMMVTKNGETTIKHGNFDAFMAELDSATTAENENAVITIDVNKDFTVGGKGYWEFRGMSPTVTLNLNLNGHTVTATAGNVIQVRTGYKLNIDGADESGKSGTWIATGGGASMFFVRDVRTEVKAENLNIVCTNLSTSDQPVLHFMIGDVYMKNVRVTYTGTNFPSNGTIVEKNIIKQGSGKLTLDNCVLEDASSGKLKFTAINSYSSPTVELKNTEIKAYYGFKSDYSTINMENSKVMTNAEVFNGNSTVFVTDSELITSGSSISAAKCDITYKYGTGKNSVTIGSGTEFADNYKTDVEAHFTHKGNGKYVLESGTLEEVTVTIVKNGVTTTEDCSFDAFMTELDNQETSLSENTTYTVVINKSFTVGGKGWWELRNMSPTATLNIDLNGHTVTASSGNVVQVRTPYTLNMEGTDDQGNIGTWRAVGGAASMFYMQLSAGADARANIENINIVCTNLSTVEQPVLHLASGITTMKNVNVTYTGTDFPQGGTIEDKYTNDGAVAKFINPVTIGDYVSYTLQPEVYIEGYGTIPAEKADANAYPIVLFQGGEFKGAYGKTQFTDAMSAARGLVDSENEAALGKAQILLRGNVTSVGNDQNLGAAVGTIDVNLGGFTVTQTDSTQLFFARTKTYSADKQSFTLNVYGGEIIVRGKLLALGTQSNATYEQYKSANINFTNVKITATYGLDRSDFLVEFTNGSQPMTMPVYYTIEFTDCVFDVSGLLKATNVLNFNSTSEVTPVAATVTVNGGEIILGNTTANSNIYTSNDKSNVTFGKGSDGSYLKLTVPSKVTSSTVNNKVTLDTGVECVFAKASVDGEYATYQAYPEVMVGYKIKSSVSLYSNLVYNIYVPINDYLSSVSVNGEAIALDETMITEIDNVKYYRIPVSLAVADSLDDIELSVSLISGDSTVNAKWTLNIAKYAKIVLGGNESDEEKALVRDMLSYARAAYVYFNTTGRVSDEELLRAKALVDELIGADYDVNNTPEMNENAVNTVGGELSSASVDLGEKISLVFVVGSGYTPEDFEFTMGGVKLEKTVVGNKVYLTTYGYAIRRTVEYTVSGTDISGSFNLKCYYDNASAEVQALLARLIKYSESAEVYKDFVVGKEK